MTLKRRQTPNRIFWKGSRPKSTCYPHTAHATPSPCQGLNPSATAIWASPLIDKTRSASQSNANPTTTNRSTIKHPELPDCVLSRYLREHMNRLSSFLDRLHLPHAYHFFQTKLGGRKAFTSRSFFRSGPFVDRPRLIISWYISNISLTRVGWISERSLVSPGSSFRL